MSVSSTTIKLSFPATREFREIPVLFEDEHLLALDKPAGLLTCPDRLDPARPSLMKLLHAGIERGARWVTERGLGYLMNAYRLDPETSGVLLLAKSKPVLTALANLFNSEKPYVKYVALVQGVPKQSRFEVDLKLAPHPVKPNLMRVDRQRGKKSKTQFEVLEQFSGYTLLRCMPQTGRTHQIRVHLRHLGLPIAGDELYAGKPLLLSRLKADYKLKPGRTERPLVSSVALHAEELTLPHPVTRQRTTITAAWPKGLTVAVKYLRRYACR